MKAKRRKFVNCLLTGSIRRRYEDIEQSLINGFRSNGIKAFRILLIIA